MYEYNTQPNCIELLDKMGCNMFSVKCVFCCFFSYSSYVGDVLKVIPEGIITKSSHLLINSIYIYGLTVESFYSY